MRYTPQQAAMIMQQMKDVIACEETDDMKLWGMWHKLVGYRAQLLGMMIKDSLGGRVYSGPFKGMRLTSALTAGISAPMQLGLFEHELHPIIERMTAMPFTSVLNIGCSFGYYSVGLALRMPQATVHAYDIDEHARTECQAMADLNHVQERIRIGGEFRGDDFAVFAGEKTLLFMDIEGAELDLLDPECFPALKTMALIVELHDVYRAGISAAIRERFRSTHDVQIIPNEPILAAADLSFLPAGSFDVFDRLIMAWENRSGPTPWGVFIPKVIS